jgi:hypothetical protein
MSKYAYAGRSDRTHAPAQLIQLRKPVPVGSIDDDGVRVRDVEPVLDNRRREQDVELPLNEASIARSSSSSPI